MLENKWIGPCASLIAIWLRKKSLGTNNKGYSQEREFSWHSLVFFTLIRLECKAKSSHWRCKIIMLRFCFVLLFLNGTPYPVDSRAAKIILYPVVPFTYWKITQSHSEAFSSPNWTTPTVSTFPHSRDFLSLWSCSWPSSGPSLAGPWLFCAKGSRAGCSTPGSFIKLQSFPLKSHHPSTVIVFLDCIFPICYKANL